MNYLKITQTTLKIFAALTMALALTACPDKNKKDRSRNYVRYDRSGDWQNYNNMNAMIDPSTGQGMQNWGMITSNYGFNGVLQSFMAGAQIGYVSGNPNDGTGIRFHGSASSQIYFLVWDDYANQSGQAFYWPMSVADAQVSSNYARIILEDSVGQVKLEGNIDYNGIWSGSVQFYNYNSNGGGAETLGNFSVPADAILN